MANNCEQALSTVTFESGADLSTTGMYRFGALNSSGQVVVATAAGVADVVIYDNPAAASRECTCVVGGIAFVELGGDVAAGAAVQVGTDGVAVSGSTNSPGKAVKGGVSGDIVPVLLKL